MSVSDTAADARLTPARAWLPPLLALLAAAALWLTGLNLPLFLLFNRLGALTSPELWAWATVLGDTLAVLTFALLLVGRRPALLWAMLWTFIFGATAVHLLKELFVTPRPPAVVDPQLLYVVGDAIRSFSFPSGHTTTAVAFAALFQLHPGSRPLTAALLGVMAVVVGLSRMAVGVHWPVDVLGGAALGWLAAVAGLALARRTPAGGGLAAQRVIALVLCGAAVALFFHDSGYPQALMLQRMIAVGCLLLALPGLWRVAAGRGQG